MVYCKILKSLSIRNAKLFPELFGVRTFCDENEFIVLMYKGSSPIGCCYCEIKDPIVNRRGLIKVNLRIDRFEIRKSFQRKGYGRYLFEWIVNNFSINKISLMYLDDNALKFWKRMGFRVGKGYNNMYKIVK